MSARAVAVIILGMHRSGTSLLAQTVRSLGVYMGNEHQMVPPREDNPEGFWEHAEIVAIHDELLNRLSSSWDTTKPLPENWLLTEAGMASRERLVQIVTRDFLNSPLWGFKDPRTCLLLPLWQSVFKELSIDARYILNLRNPLNVAASLYKRDQFLYDKSFAIWNLYVLSSLYYTSHEQRIVIDYDQLLEQPIEACRRISGFLNVPYGAMDQARVSDLPKPALRHNCFSKQDVWEDRFVPAMVRQTYLAGMRGERDPYALHEDELRESIRKDYDQLVQTDRFLSHEKSYRVRFYWAGADGQFKEEKSTYVTVNAKGQKSCHTVEIRESLGSVLRIDFFAKPAYVKLFRLCLIHEGEEADLLRDHAKEYVNFLAFTRIDDGEDYVSGIVTGSTSQLLIRDLPPHNEGASVLLELSCSFGIEAEVVQGFQLQRPVEVELTTALRNASLRIERLLIANSEKEKALELAAAQIKQQIDTLELLCEDSRSREAKLSALSRELQEEQAEASRRNTEIEKREQQMKYDQELFIRQKDLEIEKREQQMKYDQELFIRQKDLEIEKYRREVALYSKSLSWKITLPLRIAREIERRAKRRLKGWAKGLLQEYALRRNRYSRQTGLAGRLPYKQNALIFSHTNYLESMGGTEKYIYEQASYLSRRNIGIIQIYPGQSYSLLNTKEDTYYGVIVNDQLRGFYPVKEITEWLSRIHEQLSDIYTHHLLNWEINDYRTLLRNVEEAGALPHTLFMHDFFTVCSSYHMVYQPKMTPSIKEAKERHSCIADVVAASGANADICLSCTHGMVLADWRNAIRPVLLQADRIVVPSEIVKETVIAIYPDLADKMLVRGHLIFNKQTIVYKPRPEHRKIRLAFLGYKMDNKGWSLWERLYKDEALGLLYEFHHIGSQKKYADQVAVHHYSFLREGRMGASNLLIAQDIDLVLLWSIVPESYSYTLQEAIAAGVLVLTSPLSGNIAATIDEHPELGKVWSGEDQLRAFLLDSEQVRAYVSGNRARYTLEYNHLPSGEREARS
ncbi:sulfotransferase [Paenibacillus periandrae]|uniref:sulfotransferase n=1 Tax=Paenibacillus periandrae TaxID=1761741 RepID=UPI001F08E24C|nr:sulfotransferase [Paenibacillus periandrae]